VVTESWHILIKFSQMMWFPSLSLSPPIKLK
jgi:hypothetical protein